MASHFFFFCKLNPLIVRSLPAFVLSFKLGNNRCMSLAIAAPAKLIIVRSFVVGGGGRTRQRAAQQRENKRGLCSADLSLKGLNFCYLFFCSCSCRRRRRLLF
jgi:hypothetical protein